MVISSVQNLVTVLCRGTVLYHDPTLGPPKLEFIPQNVTAD